MKCANCGHEKDEHANTLPMYWHDDGVLRGVLYQCPGFVPEGKTLAAPKSQDRRKEE